MITAVRTANVHDAKMGEALAWAVKLTRYLRDKMGMNMNVVRNVGGPVFQLHWVSTHESLADLDKTLKRVEADPGYAALVAEARAQGLFIATSLVDSLYESIPMGN